MADVSLDVYIQRNKIGVKRNVSLPVQTDVARSNVPLKRNMHIPPGNYQPQTKKVFDARAKINPTNTPVVIVRPNQDARQRLLAKKKLANAVIDARSRIQAKVVQPPLNVFNNLQFGALEKPQQPLDFYNKMQFGEILMTFNQPMTGQSVMSVGGQLRKTIANEHTSNIVLSDNKSSTNLANPPLVRAPQKEIATNITNPQSTSQTILKRFASGNESQQNTKPSEKQVAVQNHISPIQSFRVIISNLGPNVTYDDVEELFGSCGPLRKIKMSRPGSVEVYYINKESALAAVEEYHKRELDDKPMSVALAFIQGNSTEFNNKPLRTKKQMAAIKQSLELDSSIVNDALFRGSSDASSHPVDFTVHL